MNHKICAILITYQPDILVLAKVLNSLHNQVDRLKIIDNFSTNRDDLKKLVSNYNNITFDLLDRNIGLASAQNKGIKFAIENGYSHVVLFDQDSVISPGFIESLLNGEKQLIDRGKKIAAVGPLFFDPNNNEEYPATIYNGCFIKKVKLDSDPVEATFIIASGCLIRTRIFSHIGTMADELFIDYIDVEWSLRAKYKGYSVYVIPSAKMAHTIGDSRASIFGRTISIHSPFRRYFLMRNSFYMLKKPYIPIGYKLREVSFNIIRFLFALFSSDDKKTLIKYSMRALKDGISGRFGPYYHE